MTNLINVNFNDLTWQPHPTLLGIDVKLLQNPQDYTPDDMLIARVVPDGTIPWHVHPQQSEITYVLQGEGVLSYAVNETYQPAFTIALQPGCTAVVPPGIWHMVTNTGHNDLHIFAAHTP